jgi:hypothetical protein
MLLRMVHVERAMDGALLLEVDPACAGAINMVLVWKGVKISELSAWRPAQSRAA